VKHYSSGRRLTGAIVMIMGMAILLGSVYSSIRLNMPELDVGLAVCGAAMILAGFTVNHFVVRRRVSKRGYFFW